VRKRREERKKTEGEGRENINSQYIRKLEK
jgi:hypothetical protein